MVIVVSVLASWVQNGSIQHPTLMGTGECRDPNDFNFYITIRCIMYSFEWRRKTDLYKEMKSRFLHNDTLVEHHSAWH